MYNSHKSNILGNAIRYTLKTNGYHFITKLNDVSDW